MTLFMKLKIHEKGHVYLYTHSIYIDICKNTQGIEECLHREVTAEKSKIK
jgi:hypothetical protein